jgi:futalosine hydrolase
MNKIDIAILGATRGEILSLSESFPQSEKIEIAGNVFTRHVYRNLSLLIGSTGIGKVNAAAITSAVLSRFRVMEVWSVGCAGGYGGAGLRIGDVVITRDSLCGDEGVLSRDGPSSMELIGIPLVQKEGIFFYDRFPLAGFETFCKLHALLPPGSYREECLTCPPQPGRSDDAGENSFLIRYGNSVTVSMASGDVETAEKRFQVYAALAENMEGSAVAQVCFLLDVPFLECRGISNIAGIRDKKNWNLGLAVEHSHAVIRHVLNSISMGEY